LGFHWFGIASGVVCAAVLAGPTGVVAQRHEEPRIVIRLEHGTPREQLAKATLEAVLASVSPVRYTFTHEIVIAGGAINHAFPVLTLNVLFAESGDDLLSTFVHEQLHWYLRDHDAQQRAAVADLRRIYPVVPVGLPKGADSEYSTYGHLVDCYLELEADRQLLGPDRALAVVRRKPWYTWIYSTVLSDERTIAAVVDRHRLRVPER